MRTNILLVQNLMQTVFHTEKPLFLIFFFEKSILKKVSRHQQKHEILPSMHKVKKILCYDYYVESEY